MTSTPPPAVRELARAARQGATRGRRWTLAIDGPSGAGKSDLARQVEGELLRGGKPVLVVRLDDLYPGWDGLEGGVHRLVDGVLAPFHRGEDELRLARWDWAADRDGPVQRVRLRSPAPVLVVEGVGAGARACAPFVSLLVWVEAPGPIRRARALARDGAAFAANWERWAAQERVHFGRERTRDRADLHVDTRHDPPAVDGVGPGTPGQDVP